MSAAAAAAATVAVAATGPAGGMAVRSLVWAALRQSAKVVAASNALGFAITAVTQSHKITDLTGTAAFAASAWATHVAASRWVRCGSISSCSQCYIVLLIVSLPLPYLLS